MGGGGATIAARYDASGNLVEARDATDIVVTRAYDERDRVVTVDDPTRGPLAGSYDKNGNLELVKEFPDTSEERTIQLFDDPVDRLTKTTDPLLNERLFGYDKQDNVVNVVDSRQAIIVGGKPTTFDYDPLGRRIRRTDTKGEIWEFAYDPLDNLELIVDAKGQRIEQLFDELSRLVSITTKLADGTTEDTITFTYDANGNRLTAADNDSSLAFTYDKLNRLKTAETLAEPGTVQPPVTLTSTYDAVGNRTQLQATEGPIISGTWTHGYDTAGRLSSLVSPGGDPLSPVSLTYDAAGRLIRTEFPNSVTSEASYDPFTGRIDRMAHTSGSSELASLTYTTQPDGLIKSVVEPAGIRYFAYDATRQLLSGGFDTSPESYAYDEVGNRTNTHLSTTYSHDEANRLTEDDSFCYAYDANGNLESKTSKIAGSCVGSPTTTYVWDVQDRLTRIEFPDLSSVDYRYDAFGRRIEKSTEGGTERYFYNGLDIILQFDGTNVLSALYSHGDLIDQPLVLERNEQSFYYHFDHLRSVRKLTDSNGSVVNSYDYDSFGQFETRVETVPNPYTFTSREFDQESGNYYYRARYYAPRSGRFLSEDPLGFASGDLNLYRYVFNSPVNLVDPLGLVALIEFGGTSCTAAALGSTVGGFFGAIASVLLGAAAVAIASPDFAASGGEILEAAGKLAVATGAGEAASAAACGSGPLPPKNLVELSKRGGLSADFVVGFKLNRFVAGREGRNFNQTIARIEAEAGAKLDDLVRFFEKEARATKAERLNIVATFIHRDQLKRTAERLGRLHGFQTERLSNSSFLFTKVVK